MGVSRDTVGHARVKPLSRGTLRASVLVVLIVPLLAATTPAASAAPRAETLARAADVKKEVDALDRQVEILAEEYNAAAEEHAGLLVQEQEAARVLQATAERLDQLQTRLSTRAQSMYRNGPLDFVEVVLGTSDFETFAQLWDILKRINEDDARLAGELQTARTEQAEARRILAERTAQAAAAAAALASRKAEIETSLADRKRLLAGLEAEVAALDRAEELRRAEEAARAAASRKTPSSAQRSFPPPTTAARSEVVAVARQYLGAPYVWGASGPDSFDCSGFTQFVFRQVGVQLPRVSRDQINAGQRVSREDLQPGDLVFFGSPIHHVGIYVGDGMMIHSPRTGDVVKISPLMSDYVGASRP